MNENKTHDRCKHFSLKSCPNWDNAIMQQAAQDIPQHRGGKYTQLQFPTDDEINHLCEGCEAFMPE